VERRDGASARRGVGGVAPRDDGGLLHLVLHRHELLLVLLLLQLGALVGGDELLPRGGTTHPGSTSPGGRGRGGGV
jgi:hypothetical protein